MQTWRFAIAAGTVAFLGLFALLAVAPSRRCVLPARAVGIRCAHVHSPMRLDHVGTVGGGEAVRQKWCVATAAGGWTSSARLRCWRLGLPAGVG